MSLPRKAKSCQYISFDVFDTLIKRSVAKPTDLFLVMEQYCLRKKKDMPVGFAHKRREAELRANEKAGRPVTLQAIYDELREEYGDCTDALMKLEIKMELDGCQPNPECVMLFQQCIAEGKTVVLISDMYLSSEIIAQMLEKCGVRGYKKLYVSCEMGARKRDGALFKEVLSDLNISPGQLVHIGDNRRADFLEPLSMGIRAVWVKNDQKQMCKVPESIPQEAALAYRTMRACVRNCSNSMTDFEKLGCRIFGPMLYGFTQWLVEQLRRDHIHDVYFLARDGYMMKRAFDELKLEGIKTHYLYCSRRSYQVPMIWLHSEFEAVIRNFSAGQMTLRNFLLRVGLKPDEYAEEVKKSGLNLDHIYEKEAFYSSDEVKSFYDTIRGDVEENSKREYSALVAYLRTLNLAEKIAVVDIGYHGTMQRAIMELICEENLHTEVEGYYLSIVPEARYIKEKAISAQGYFHTEEKERFSGPFFELQFLTPQGSTKRFVFRNGKSEPEFDTFEYEHNENQIVDELAVMTEYQAGALAFVQYMLEAFPLNAFSVPPDVALYEFARLENSPTLKEAKFWGDFRVSNYLHTYNARPRSILFYLRHLRALREDFFTCAWRRGFIRRLLRIPLPYNRIYEIMRKVYHKI